jgi:hypothetical protein
MTPYGIVYRDNPYALQKSVEIWQKKFGVFNIPTFLKIGGISAVILLAVNLILGLFAENGIMTYMSSFIIMAVLSFVLVYMVMKNTYIKQMSLANTQKEDKQIVLYEDRLEFGTGYTRAIYYYSDIVLCSESSGVITIITDTAAMPLSIQKSSVSKGSYDEFSFILRKNMGGKYQYMGGKV